MIRQMYSRKTHTIKRTLIINTGTEPLCVCVYVCINAELYYAKYIIGIKVMI